MDDDAYYNPRYRGFAPYLGSPLISYVLIDPDRRRFVPGQMHRRDVNKLHELIDAPADGVNVVSMNTGDFCVYALHEFATAKQVTGCTSVFWYRRTRYELATWYAGKGLVIAHSPDHLRRASCRLSTAQLEQVFTFDEPCPEPIPIYMSRGPLQAALSRAGEAVEKLLNHLGGEWHGSVHLELEARGLIAMMEIMALYFGRGRQMGDREHLATPVFGMVCRRLIEEGYLDTAMMGQNLTYWANLFM